MAESGMTEVERILRNLVEHAYEHGYHEVGFDVVTAFQQQSQASALIDDILAWQRRTFPDGTAASCAKHLLKEAHELVAKPTDGEEMADIVFLAFGAADRAGVDLWAAIRAKFEINKSRTWGTPDVDGVVHHIRDDAPPSRAELDALCDRLADPEQYADACDDAIDALERLQRLLPGDDDA
jgi:hypothetical protein